MGHDEQVCISAKGSCTLTKFSIMLCVEGQQQCEVIAKYVGKETNVYLNTSIWVPKILVTHMQGPKSSWGPKSRN